MNKFILIALAVVAIVTTAYIFGLTENVEDYKFQNQTNEQDNLYEGINETVRTQEPLIVPRKPIIDAQELESRLSSPVKINPTEKELIEDSFFYDIGFVDSKMIYGVKGFTPVSENYNTLTEYGLLQGDIIIAVNEKNVPDNLEAFISELDDMYSSPQNFFEEVVRFKINRNQEIFDLEIAID